MRRIILRRHFILVSEGGRGDGREKNAQTKLIRLGQILRIFMEKEKVSSSLAQQTIPDHTPDNPARPASPERIGFSSS